MESKIFFNIFSAVDENDMPKIMTHFIRKLVLVTHITSSVSWFGAVSAFLALSLAGLVSKDAKTVRAAYPAMDLIGWYVILPLSLASLVTGLFQSLVSPWRLFRHYWVLIKFMLTIIAIILFLLHLRYTGVLSEAAKGILWTSDLRGLKIEMMANAAAAMMLLLVNTTLSVYKPKGMTPFGQRNQKETQNEARITPRWVKVFGMIFIGL